MPISKVLSSDWENIKVSYLFTSSADCAMKNPTVFEGNLVPRGFIDILLSFPSSAFTSIANKRSFSLTKHSLKIKKKNLYQTVQGNISKTITSLIFVYRNESVAILTLMPERMSCQ